MLLIRDDRQAESLAKELDLYNIERQKIERKASDDIEKYIATHPELLDEKAIVLYSDKWHPGIIPIITPTHPGRSISPVITSASSVIVTSAGSVIISTSSVIASFPGLVNQTLVTDLGRSVPVRFYGR